MVEYKFAVPTRDEAKKSVHIKLEEFCENKYPEFTKFIRQLYPEVSHIERLYKFFNPNYVNVCPVCGNFTRFINFNKGYSKYCSPSCVSKDNNVKEKKKQTTLDNWGVENPSQCSEIVNKKKMTMLAKYGVEHFNNREQAKQTCLEKYGVENFSNREQAKQTCLERYGVESTLSLKDVIKKADDTYTIKYGGRSDMVKQTAGKAKDTKLKRYGNENFNNREQARQTCLERYGTTTYPRHKKEKLPKPKKIITQDDIDRRRINASKKTAAEYVMDVFIRDNILYYKCKCPHPECNNCSEKTYIIQANICSNRRSNGIEMCTKLMPVRRDRISDTTIELYVKRILDEYGIYYESNNRSILNGKEIDIYIPSKSIAIECNGIYWHSKKDIYYHSEKTEQCSNNNIQLITLWEDQIKKSPEKIKSIILSKLGIYDDRIYARKCIIKEVPSKECNEFLEEYHLQGKVSSSVRLGLYYNNELVSVMTFGKGRKCLNSKVSYELYRYCCKAGIQVIGGASKLFNHFLKNYKPELIESFSANDISNGNLYKCLGFEKVSSSIGYWYIDKYMNRYHRYKFAKHILVKEGFDPNKTEFEIMNDRGFLRIYDSGQTKWEWQSMKV